MVNSTFDAFYNFEMLPYLRNKFEKEKERDSNFNYPDTGYGFRNFDNFQLRCLICWHLAED